MPVFYSTQNFCVPRIFFLSIYVILAMVWNEKYLRCISDGCFRNKYGQLNQMTIYDPDIRKSLLSKLESLPTKPRAIIEELRVHNGNAIADVVALYREAHCYEIKGCADKIERVLTQGSFYNAAFRKITLVTTMRHLDKALEITHSHWGIMVADRQDERINIRSIRPARNNPGFDKELASLTLWKSEMLSLLDQDQLKKKPRAFLAHLLAESKKKTQLSTEICDKLIGRKLEQQTI